MQKLECKCCIPIYLSLKCDNSENPLIFKNEEKRWNINTQRNYTYKGNFAFGKPHKYSFYMSKLNYKFSTQMDVHSLCALLFYLLKCGILTAIILWCLISNHIHKLNIASMFIHNCLSRKLCSLRWGLCNYKDGLVGQFPIKRIRKADFLTFVEAFEQKTLLEGKSEVRIFFSPLNKGK